MSEFVSVAEEASIPAGAGRTVNVRGQEYAIYNLGAQFYALDNECPHKGGPLGAGCLEDGKVFCPLHGWGFDLTTGLCQSRPDLPVRTYPTRVLDGQVQILI